MKGRNSGSIDGVIVAAIRGHAIADMPQSGLRSFIKWNAIRKHVYQAVGELRSGGNPNFKRLPVQLAASWGVPMDDPDISRIEEGWTLVSDSETYLG
jgi:hypothetical protein